MPLTGPARSPGPLAVRSTLDETQVSIILLIWFASLRTLLFNIPHRRRRMKYRTLGRTGFEVSDIAHGLWGMSGWSESDDQQSRQAIQLALDLGCNFFDTAWAYGNGKSDGLLGEALANNEGKRIYAASKIPPKNLKWPASPKDKYQDVFPADHVFKYAQRIREKLGVD